MTPSSSSLPRLVATLATIAILSVAGPASAFVGPHSHRSSASSSFLSLPQITLKKSLLSPLMAVEPSIDALVRETLNDNEFNKDKSPLKMPPMFPPKDDNMVFHLSCLLGSTIWWYVWNSYELLTQRSSDFLGIRPGSLIFDSMASYITISQVLVVGVMWKLANAQTLRAAQGWILACIFLCVPADSIIVFFNAADSKLTTVLAFALVTMCFGVFLAHYLRIASQREDYNTYLLNGVDSAMSEEISMDFVSGTSIITEDEGSMMQVSSRDDNTEEHKGEEHHHHAKHDNVFQEVMAYKPPKNLQATHMAVAFTRSFVAFTVALAAVRDSLGGEHGMSFWLVASCASVVVHTAIEMFITTLTPGVDLEEYPEFITFEALLYSVHMIASTYIAHESPLGDSIWDELTYSWLFGNAAAEFTKRIEMLAKDVNYDDKLGLSRQES